MSATSAFGGQRVGELVPPGQGRPPSRRRDHAELREHWRGQFARRGLNQSHARLLRRAAFGKVPKTLRNHERVTASEPVNAGLLARTQSGGVELADTVTYSSDSTHRRRSRPAASPVR